MQCLRKGSNGVGGGDSAVAEVVMRLRTRVFDIGNGKYRNLSELAQAMGVSVSQVYRVRQRKRRINGGFIIGVIRAFPAHSLDELFYLEPGSPLGNNRATADMRQKYMVQKFTK